MADSVKKWYVVRAIGGQENKVKTSLIINYYLKNQEAKLIKN